MNGCLAGLVRYSQVLVSTPGGSEFQTRVKKVSSPGTMPKHKRKVPSRTHTSNGAPREGGAGIQIFSWPA